MSGIQFGPLGPGGQMPPNGAGAVDLSRLKPAPAAEIARFWQQSLIQTQMVCQCGERIRGEGRLVHTRHEGAIPGPNGAMPGLASVPVHSLECPILANLRADPNVKIIALRRMTALSWDDEIVLPESAKESS